MPDFRLAPMCGITDHVFRTLCFEQGCDLAYTEMISAMGYLCAPGQRAVQELMFRGEGEPRLIVQLFGRDPDTVAAAAEKMCEAGRFDGIDLNMGCPAKKIAPSGEGCGLMRTPHLAREMMRKTVKASSLPVSVKMRLGYDREHINVIEFAKMAEDSGIACITIHGRTREQQYSGSADWDMIARAKQSVRIPVIGNGDVFTAADAVRRLRESGTDGIMIGRGAMGNPWIFRQIRSLISGEFPVEPTTEEKHRMIRRHYMLMLRNKPEHIAVREMRKHIGWYIRGIRGAGQFRAEINRTNSAEKALKMIDLFFSGIQDDDHTAVQEDE